MSHLHRFKTNRSVSSKLIGRVEKGSACPAAKYVTGDGALANEDACLDVAGAIGTITEGLFLFNALLLAW